jgi:hypothetical protein
MNDRYVNLGDYVNFGDFLKRGGAVEKIKKKIELRICPWCGFIINKLEWDLVEVDHPCPGCRRANLSEFKEKVIEFYVKRLQ